MYALFIVSTKDITYGLIENSFSMGYSSRFVRVWDEMVEDRRRYDRYKETKRYSTRQFISCEGETTASRHPKIGSVINTIEGKSITVARWFVARVGSKASPKVILKGRYSKRNGKFEIRNRPFNQEFKERKI